jgi:hypothetical protein
MVRSLKSFACAIKVWFDTACEICLAVREIVVWVIKASPILVESAGIITSIISSYLPVLRGASSLRPFLF